MPKLKWNIIWGIFITLVFLSLLSLRLEFFQEKHKPSAHPADSSISRPAETWMNIYQNNKKIGVIHRTFTILEKGFQTREDVSMKINTMGITQVLQISTASDLHPDMTFSSIKFDLTSSLFHYNARGYVEKDKLILFTGVPGNQQKSIIPLKNIPHSSGSIYDAAFLTAMEKDTTRNFNIFDPGTLGLRSVKVTRNADEIIPIMEKRILTQKFCADFMGAKNCAWIAKDGEVLRESGILGLSMEKVSREKAHEGIASDGSLDFAQIASIPSNLKITEPGKLPEIRIKIDGIDGLPLLLHGARQIFRQGTLTITREEIPIATMQKKILPDEVKKFLQSSALVQADHPQIRAQAEKIVQPMDSPQVKLKKIVNWVYHNVEKKPALSVPNALEILKNKVGDCNEHAVLTAALLRAIGIPVQIETGLVYLNGRFYYHAWNIAYIGQWITADAVFNQIPADVTHIRLVRGEGSEQLDLVGVMGKINLEVLPIQND